MNEFATLRCAWCLVSVLKILLGVYKAGVLLPIPLGDLCDAYGISVRPSRQHVPRSQSPLETFRDEDATACSSNIIPRFSGSSSTCRV